MTTEIRSNWLTKQLDKIFDDKCLFSKSGTQQRGPGFLCGLYIILIIVGLVFNIVMTEKNMTKYGLSRGQVVLQNIIDVANGVVKLINESFNLIKSIGRVDEHLNIRLSSRFLL